MSCRGGPGPGARDRRRMDGVTGRRYAPPRLGGHPPLPSPVGPGAGAHRPPGRDRARPRRPPWRRQRVRPRAPAGMADARGVRSATTPTGAASAARGSASARTPMPDRSISPAGVRTTPPSTGRREGRRPRRLCWGGCGGDPLCRGSRLSVRVTRAVGRRDACGPRWPAPSVRPGPGPGCLAGLVGPAGTTGGGWGRRRPGVRVLRRCPVVPARPRWSGCQCARASASAV